MPRTGRPKKTTSGLTNDIKVRVDDDLLRYINAYTRGTGGERAEVIRIAIFRFLWDAVISSNHEIDSMEEASYLIGMAGHYLALAHSTIDVHGIKGMTKETKEGVHRLYNSIMELENKIERK